MTKTPTYNDQQIRTPFFDWNIFLNKKNITSAQFIDAKNKSSKWVTCACGNQCASIPRDLYGEPKDQLLRGYGNDFGYAILTRNVPHAKILLNKIEKRSQQILNEIQ
jgi:hypothetical protein